MRQRRRAIPRGLRRGITLRMLAPNAVTAMALCFGLTGVRYGIAGEWERAVACIVLAENAALDEKAEVRAQENGIAVLKSAKGAFEIAVMAAEALKS